MTTTLTTSPEERAAPPPGPAWRAPARRVWRSLTSMRTALLLLFLLALASIPGSLLPQENLDPGAVQRWVADHPDIAPLLERLSLFDVYASPWFAAIYLALMVSLVGCLAPRIRLHWKALRAAPPAPPRHLERLPVYRSFVTSGSPDVRGALRGWRVREHENGVAAERGYLRETGNLVFHVALLTLLVGIGIGAFWGYQGAVLVVEGDTFVNTPAAYDQLKPGRLNSVEDLPPFEVTLDDFRATYLANGQPASFAADVRWRRSESAAARDRTIKVNEPLTVDGARVYLLDHGYALHFTMRLRDGSVVYDQWQPFLPERGDPNLSSGGALKVTDLGGGRPDIGVRGLFTPTLAVRGGFAFSSHPEPKLPAFAYEVWAGDLGLSSGVPQSVYDLDTAEMVRAGNGIVFPGQTVSGLPAGATLTFDGVKEFAVFQVTVDPGKFVVLGSAIAALTGLVLSLRVRRRRVWVRTTPGEAGTLVEVGGLARHDPESFAPEVSRLVERMEGRDG